jgi:uncharacterized protein YdhG (YjbR/CyaY superfamily)
MPARQPAPKPATVAEYIRAAPKEARPKLRQLRKIVREEAPGAEEGLKWGMPSLWYRRILLSYAAHTRHVGFYPGSSAVKAFAKRLTKFKTARGSIQFPYADPLPVSLIRGIVKFRVAERKEKDVRWRSPAAGRTGSRTTSR